MKKRALVSVSDKTGIVEACKTLAELGYEIISTGGTFKVLKEAGLPVIGISDVTGFPECLDGRVKTLHPAVHAGLLAMRSDPEHMAQLKELGINTIDVVIVNLYPFKQTIMREGIDFQEAVENIDIGGPTMLRSAAKNFQDVIVIVDPKDYERVFAEMRADAVTMDTRKYLMYKVYQHTAVYDTLISTYLRQKLGIEFPEQLTLAYEKKDEMRYGENPHQKAASYSEVIPVKNSLINATFLNGKPLSYNNINDTNGAVELLKEFKGRPTVVAVKHMQEQDRGVISKWDVVTEKAPTEEEKKTMEFAMKVVKHCKSNAIVIAKGEQTQGIGVGQTNRIWATKQAAEHCADPKGCVLASDAFFPFDDCVCAAHEAGITAIVQPGGSIRDKDSIDKCNEFGISMVFSGSRHFKH